MNSVSVRPVDNFFAPGFEFIAQHYGEPETQTIEHDGETYTLTTLTEIEDGIEQVVRETRTVEQDGDVILEASFRLALISKREFELLLETTGWSDWSVYGGFDRDPLESTDQEMVWIAQK